VSSPFDLKPFIREVPDFPKAGISFKDITTLLNNPEAFRSCIQMMAERYRDAGLAKIVGVESRGFIFAAPLAYELGVGLVPVRKKGKLPAKCVQQTYELEYGSDVVEMHCDAVQAGDNVLVVDDVIATGGTLVAACQLVEALGGNVVEAVAVLELGFLDGRQKLESRPLYTMVQF
jgi:adenine phosphoribosyltransferase